MSISFSFFSSLSLSPFRSQRRGQASFEYLSTYGFAILGLLVALGAINYFGLFNPATLHTNGCTITPGLACVDYVASVANQGAPGDPQPYARLLVVNEYGVNLTVTAVTASFKQDPATRACDVQPAGTWVPGDNRTIWCPIAQKAFIVGQHYDGIVNVNFTQTGGTYTYGAGGTFSFISQ